MEVARRVVHFCSDIQHRIYRHWHRTWPEDRIASPRSNRRVGGFSSANAVEMESRGGRQINPATDDVNAVMGG
jgi:hypothetical protein